MTEKGHQMDVNYLPKSRLLKDKPGKAGSSKASTTAKPRNYRTTASMVNEAIKAFGAERRGTSLAAIKKYLIDIYELDMERQAKFIRKYLRSAVESGAIIRTNGIGANGSFKVSTSTKRREAKFEADTKKKAAAKKLLKKTAAAKESAKAAVPKSKAVKSVAVAKEKKVIESTATKPKVHTSKRNK